MQACARCQVARQARRRISAASLKQRSRSFPEAKALWIEVRAATTTKTGARFLLGGVAVTGKVVSSLLERSMQIRVGYELIYRCPQPTPMVVTLSIHFGRVSDLIKVDHLLLSPSVPITAYRDSFGNWCSRIVAPTGQLRLSSDAVVSDTGKPDPVAPWLGQRPVEALPEETLLFLLGSRYCETDLLTATAWSLFGGAPTGWKRVQAICDFVHQHVQFGYGLSSPTKSALQVFQDPKGVCRDFAHLAVTLCRCMNIPARYCTGYLGDIGVPPPHSPMDFAAWFEAYLGDGWYTFDPRNNAPRIGRILIARGRDAGDVALTTSFGLSTLESFKVWAEEIRP